MHNTVDTVDRSWGRSKEYFRFSADDMGSDIYVRMKIRCTFSATCDTGSLRVAGVFHDVV